MTGTVWMLNGGDPGSSIGGRTLNVNEMAEGLAGRGWAVDYLDVRRTLPLSLPGKYSILHVHGYQGSYAGALLRLRHRARSVPILTTLHGWLWGGVKYRAMNRLELAALHLSDRTAVQSQAMASRLEALRVRGVSIVPTGVHPTARNGEARREPCFTVLCIGRVAPEKRLDVTLRAFAHAQQQAPDMRLDVVGPLDDGRLVADLVTLARTLGIERRVHWWGQQSHPWDRVTPDAVLLTSDTEGLPRVLLEAQHRGVPAVATRVGGVPDIIDHGVNGLLSARRDHRDLGLHLAHLASHADAGARMAFAALGRSADFTVSTMLDRYETLYRDVLKPRRVAS